jgi:molecular chaperone GrpE
MSMLLQLCLRQKRSVASRVCGPLYRSGVGKIQNEVVPSNVGAMMMGSWCGEGRRTLVENVVSFVPKALWGRSVSTGRYMVFDTDASGSEKEAKQEEESSSSSQKQDGSDLHHMDTEQLHAHIQELRKDLEDKEKSIEELKDRMMRTLADMENLRDRTSKQLEEARKFATQGLVKSLVEVADNLERAAASVMKDVDETEVDVERALALLHSLKDGVVMTDSILMKILENEGVKRYDPLGEQFDPNLHNALFEVPDATREPGTVAVVIKKGYLLHDRAVRAADVGVVRESQ